MLKLIVAGTAGILLAGAVIALPDQQPAKAGNMSPPATSAEEAMPVPVRAAPCATQVWPYYDQSCLAAKPETLRRVRVVSTDRVAVRFVETPIAAAATGPVAAMQTLASVASTLPVVAMPAPAPATLSAIAFDPNPVFSADQVRALTAPARTSSAETASPPRG